MTRFEIPLYHLVTCEGGPYVWVHLGLDEANNTLLCCVGASGEPREAKSVIRGTYLHSFDLVGYDKRDADRALHYYRSRQ
jgi:hypothetical protein